MTADRQPQHQHAQLPTIGAWEKVRRWAGVSAADKLAWLYLWQRTRGGRQQIDITAAEIAADQGVTSDAGRQRVKNLRDLGFMNVLRSDKSTGLYRIELCDQVDCGPARITIWDGQLDLPLPPGESWRDDLSAGEPADTIDFLTRNQAAATSGGSPYEPCVPAQPDDMDVGCRPPMPAHERSPDTPASLRLAGGHRGSSGGSSTEDPPEVPRSSRARQEPSKHSLSLSGEELNNTFSHSPSPSKVRASTQRAGRTEEPPEDPRRGSAADDGRAVAGLPTVPPGGDADDYDPLVLRILRRVNCRNMREAPALKAAAAVHDGLIAESDLEALLENLDSLRRHHKLRAPPSAYFNGGIKRLLSGAPRKPR